MFHVRNQIQRLLTVSALSSLKLGACWVALLAARGFSPVEIGFAESVFHIVSLIFEIPSGVISDVFGRRRAMMISQLMGITSSLLMALSRGMPGVLVAIAFSALSYNFASGTREALAYDSLKAGNREEEYLKYSSTEMMIYRVCSAVSTLCAGLSLMIGYIWANLFDALIDGIALGVLVYVKEAPGFVPTKPGDAVRRICQCFQETGRFLLTNLQAEKIMLMNAFAGAIAILLEFFLQSALIEAGMIRSMLGPALFAVSMGGALGAKLSAGLGKIRYAHLACISTLGVTGAMAMGLSGAPLLMTVGGFLALMLDDALQVRTDALLNDMFPSSQRATLISVSSLCFSMIMIILSPVVGWMFGHL